MQRPLSMHETDCHWEAIDSVEVSGFLAVQIGVKEELSSQAGVTPTTWMIHWQCQQPPSVPGRP